MLFIPETAGPSARCRRAPLLTGRAAALSTAIAATMGTSVRLTRGAWQCRVDGSNSKKNASRGSWRWVTSWMASSCSELFVPIGARCCVRAIRPSAHDAVEVYLYHGTSWHACRMATACAASTRLDVEASAPPSLLQCWPCGVQALAMRHTKCTLYRLNRKGLCVSNS